MPEMTTDQLAAELAAPSKRGPLQFKNDLPLEAMREGQKMLCCRVVHRQRARKLRRQGKLVMPIGRPTSGGKVAHAWYR